MCLQAGSSCHLGLATQPGVADFNSPIFPNRYQHLLQEECHLGGFLLFDASSTPLVRYLELN